MPHIHPTAFVAPNATVLFDVTIGADASVWYGVVIRGDAERVVVGAGSNVQDLSVLHADPGFPCILGERVSVGHRAIVHGAVVGDGALIGMGAILLNGAVVGPGAVVGAGALVPEGMEIAAGMLAVGTPARVVRPVAGALAARRDATAGHYVAQARRHREALEEG